MVKNPVADSKKVSIDLIPAIVKVSSLPDEKRPTLVVRSTGQLRLIDPIAIN